jgi:hypothetical protein
VFYFHLSTKGRTRLVLVFGVAVFGVALKIARGKRGRRSNRYEHRLYWRVSERRRAMLCPILWCAPLGIILVSRAARPLREEEKNHLIDTNEFPDWDWEHGSPDNESPFEFKASDWGVLDGRVVALDYAAPVLFCDDVSRPHAPTGGTA